jgi:hypothetical protein
MRDRDGLMIRSSTGYRVDPEPRTTRRHRERQAARCAESEAFAAHRRRQTVQTVGAWLAAMEGMPWYERARLAFRAWPEGFALAVVGLCLGALGLAALALPYLDALP